MPAQRNRNIRAVLVGAGALALAALPPASASAEGLLEALFGALHRARIPPNVRAFSDPFDFLRGQQSRPGPRDYVASGPTHCVRTCDGMHFPLHRSAGNPVEVCRAFCPGSPTKVVYGGSIDSAVAGDGTRYADFDNAYVYRDRIVANCTCNGRDPFGLARLDALTDPTLRPGDVVVTPSGLAAFTGGRGSNGDFTPVAQYGNFPKGYREKLSELKIMPPVTPQTAGGAVQDADPPALEDHRRVQLSR